MRTAQTRQAPDALPGDPGSRAFIRSWPRRRRRAACGGVTLAAVLLAAGCGGSSGKRDGTASTTRSTATSSSVTSMTPTTAGTSPGRLMALSCETPPGENASPGLRVFNAADLTLLESHALPLRSGDALLRYNDVSICRDAFPQVQYRARSIFNDDFTKAAATIDANSGEPSFHVGYVTVATREVTDLTAPRVKEGFSAQNPQEGGATFAHGDTLLFSQLGKTEVLSIPASDGTQEPSAWPDAPAVSPDGDPYGHGEPTGGWTVGPNQTVTVPDYAHDYGVGFAGTEMPVVPSRFGDEQAAGGAGLGDCEAPGCILTGSADLFNQTQAVPTEVPTTGDVVGCVPLVWIAKTKLLCSSDDREGNDADPAQHLLAVATVGSGHLKLTALTTASDRELDNAVLSPDATQIAFEATNGDGTTIYTLRLSDPPPIEPQELGHLDPADSVALMEWIK